MPAPILPLRDSDLPLSISFDKAAIFLLSIMLAIPQPATKRIKPHRKPPVGPKIAPMPALKPANTGTPQAPAAR